MVQIAKEFLGIKVRIASSGDYELHGHKEERLLELLLKVGCKTYYCGPASKNYLDSERFKEAGIDVVFKDTNYPTYKQVYEPFDPFVSIIDLLLCTGPEAPYYIWGWRQ